ncbi:MAG: RDD family protein, partial [Planctomycetota bacterium]|nr:RDD family protein [Planctomycetota bacterium]
LIYDASFVAQTTGYTDDAPPGYPPYNDLQLLPPLPPVTTVLSLAASPENLWALVRVEDPAALEQIDNPAAPGSPGSTAPATTTPAAPPTDALPWNPYVPIRLPPTTATAPASAPTTAPATAPTTQADATPSKILGPAIGPAPARRIKPATSAPANLGSAAATRPATTRKAIQPAIRLLHLERGSWVRAPLPEAWPTDARQAWALQLRPDDATPTLLAVQPGDQASAVRVFQHRDGAWASREFELPGRGELAPLAVDSQLIIAQSDTSPEGVAVRLFAVDVEKLHPVGSLALPTGASGWGAAPLGHGVSLVARDAKGLINWAMLDLQGVIIQPWMEVAPQSPLPLYRSPGAVLQVGVLIGAFMLMFIFWRHDAEALKAKMPAGFIAADLPRRALAAAIDLLPCILIGFGVFRTSPLDIVDHWPRTGAGWEEMQAGILTIVLFVLYGFLVELFTARTLGKRITGLRVCSLDGSPPNLWQVLGRNLLKAFDLISIPLLILPMIRPHGQRLGDLVARTIVVQPGSEEEADSSDEED